MDNKVTCIRIFKVNILFYGSISEFFLIRRARLLSHVWTVSWRVVVGPTILFRVLVVSIGNMVSHVTGYLLELCRLLHQVCVIYIHYYITYSAIPFILFYCR